MPAPHRPSLDQSSLAAGAPAWTTVEVVAEAPSTNALVAERARAGAAEGLVVVAEHQTAGRGRLDRRWETPPRAALTFSVLLRPDSVPAERWPLLPLAVGVAVVDALREYAVTGCSLKWPNDVMCDGRKLGGLLVERVDGPAGAAAVVGVGLNVSTLRAELPVETATSLALEGVADLDRGRLLVSVLHRLGERVSAWRSGAVSGLVEDYRARCVTVGQRVRVHLPGGEVREGLASAVEADGALRVETATGVLVVRSGDVVHVRPAG